MIWFQIGMDLDNERPQEPLPPFPLGVPKPTVQPTWQASGNSLEVTLDFPGGGSIGYWRDSVGDLIDTVEASWGDTTYEEQLGFPLDPDQRAELTEWAREVYDRIDVVVYRVLGAIEREPDAYRAIVAAALPQEAL